MIELRISGPAARASGGFSLVELMVALAVFSAAMAGLYSSYFVQMKAGVKEYRLAEAEMEFQIGQMVMERDLAMAGYGIADDYSSINPSLSFRVVDATDGNPDALTMVGVALGRESRASQAWSYTMVSSAGTPSDYYPFPLPAACQDAREKLRPGADVVVYLNAATGKLLTLPGGATNGKTGKSWLFPFPPSSANPRPDPLQDGIFVYGMQSEPAGSGAYADNPFYTVGYSLGGTAPSYCAPGSKNLQRSETRMNDSGNSQPLINCVLDFQVAFGLDTNEDGLIDCWDNGGAAEATGYPDDVLRTRLKQIKVYVLVQQGNKDPAFIAPDAIRVGDAGLTSCAGTGVGRSRPLSAAQKNYRWKVIALSVTPRNLR